MSASILIVVPAYREAGRIRLPLSGLCGETAALPVEILVVDDGSGPEEAAAVSDIVESLRASYTKLLPVLALPRNLGKGGAVYAGWEHAGRDAEWLGFVDADGATPPREAARVAAMLAGTDSDFLIASRVKMLGHSLDRTLKRHIFGRAFATISTILTGVAVYDSQCGCKFLRRGVYEKIRPRLHDSRFCFDMDLISHAHHAGAKIREVPVDWTDIPGSKVHILRDGFRMLAALLRIRANLRAGG